jgi:hypothetical protein
MGGDFSTSVQRMVCGWLKEYLLNTFYCRRSDSKRFKGRPALALDVFAMDKSQQNYGVL